METQIFKASYFNHMPVAGQILDTASLSSVPDNMVKGRNQD
jgi:hypothetical protein